MIFSVTQNDSTLLRLFIINVSYSCVIIYPLLLKNVLYVFNVIYVLRMIIASSKVRKWVQDNYIKNKLTCVIETYNFKCFVRDSYRNWKKFPESFSLLPAIKSQIILRDQIVNYIELWLAMTNVSCVDIEFGDLSLANLTSSLQS